MIARLFSRVFFHFAAEALWIAYCGDMNMDMDMDVDCSLVKWLGWWLQKQRFDWHWQEKAS